MEGQEEDEVSADSVTKIRSCDMHVIPAVAVESSEVFQAI